MTPLRQGFAGQGDTGKAVFLSYASQDAEAAKRICEALRESGVEVWFDQSELVGGDAWDAKIRKQIKDCALFVPLISAATQTRTEGYFRLEWRLADQRTHLMGRGRAFLLPVCIDDTKDADADVPDSFSAVQWTRLKDGETPPVFAERVKKLLGGSDVGGALRPDSSESSRHKAAPTKNSLWLIPVIVVLAAFAGIWQQQRNRAKTVPPEPKGQAIAPAAPLSAARQKAAESAKLHDQLENASRSDLELAEQFCQQAVALDPNDGEVWAEYALVASNFIAMGYDRSDEQLLAVRTRAERAVKLAPASNLAQLALATAYRWQTATQDEAIRRLRELAERMPADRLVLRSMGNALRLVGKSEEALSYFARAAALPGGDPLALFHRAMALEALGRNEEAIASLDQSLALHPGAAAYLRKVFLLARRGELEAARAVLDKVPAPFLVEDRGALAANLVYYMQRQWDQSLNALLAVPRDYFEDSYYTGPKGLLTGDARFQAGRKLAAELDWRAALQLVTKRLAAGEDNRLLYLRKAELHARLREADEADRAMRTFQELQGGGGLLAKARIDVPLNRLEAAIQSLQAMKLPREIVVNLRQDPEWDPLRGDPRFQALLVEPVAPSPISQLPSLSSPPQVDSKSVAVLAFANLSDDKANEYFSDGISEELLNVLAKVPGLKVSARTSAFYFKGKEVPIPEIAKQLGVAYVVEGSVRKQGDKVRITAQLIKAADGFHVWSDTFTRDLKDIFAVQDEIAGLIAKNLQLKMGIEQASARRAIDPVAYQEYLAGRAAAAKASHTDLQEAVTHFEKAVAVEPKFTAAWVQLASAHTQLGRWGGAPTLRSWSEARAAIDRARSLEPDSPDVLLALGWILRTAEWDWRGAEQAFRRSLELRPNHPDSLAGTAVLLFNIGKTEEAFRLGQQAAQLDPLNAATQIDLSIMFYLNHDWAGAERTARRALQLAPGGSSYHSILAWGLIEQKRYAEAEAEAGLDSDEIARAQAHGSLAIARGQNSVAQKWLARLEEIALTRGESADLQMNIAWISVGLGDKDRAFAAIEKARITRDPSLSWLRNSWYLDNLSSDPRWPVLVRKLGLADDQLK